MDQAKRWVIFGGAGFIGTHFIRQTLEKSSVAQIISADIAFSPIEKRPLWYQNAISSRRLIELYVDIRNPIVASELESGADLAIHLAAVHSEPGFEPHEYFETNLKGSQEVAEWLERTSTPKLLFTSSIAVYGNTRGGVDESSTPMPETPYGISKLVAEQLFHTWQAHDPDRKLVIIRPAVIFGEMENGNLARLVRAVNHGYFFYLGNKGVHKGGGYVKELARCMAWLIDRMVKTDEVILANFGLKKVPTLQDYVESIKLVSGRNRMTPSLPYRAAYIAAKAITSIAAITRRTTPIHPRRIEKLTWETNGLSKYLETTKYPFEYSLESALRDWKADCPKDWD